MLSEAMCERAGLQRNTPPGESTPFTIPTGERLSKLSHSVVWSDAELDALLGSIGLNRESLDPYITEFGYKIGDDLQPGFGPLVTKPLLQTDSGIVIGLPGALLTALSRSVLDMASTFGLLDELSAAFHETSMMKTGQSLEKLGYIELDVELDSDTSCLSHKLFQFDSDKLLHLVVITDDLGTYSEEEPFGEASYPDGGKVDACLRQGLQHTRENYSDLYEVLGMVVMSGVSRSSAFGMNGGSPDQQVLVFQLSDLIVLSYLESNNEMYLWYFSEARRRLRASAGGMSWSIADELCIYRSNESCFYFSDDARPNFVNFGANDGGSLELEVVQKFDPHAIKSGPNTIQECLRVYPGSSIPAYHPRFIDPLRPSQCVSIGSDAIWVRTTLPVDSPNTQGHSFAIHLVDAASFWLSKLIDQPFVQTAIESNLSIEIVVDSPEKWDVNESSSIEFEDDWVARIIWISATKVRIHYPPTTVHFLRDDVGTPEISLIAPVVLAVASLIELDPDTAKSSLARVIASPHHRKIVPLTAMNGISILSHGIPKNHLVPVAAEQIVLDKVGQFLESSGIPIGPIPSDERKKTLNQVVNELYLEMVEILKQYDSEELIRWLIAHNEASVVEHEYKKRMEPFVLACFEDESESALEFANSIIETSKSDMASRFLIEHVAASPQSGTNSMSYSVYDHLLAIVSKIIFFGMQSDDIEFGLDDPNISHLPSGRLGIQATKRIASRDRYLSSMGTGSRARILRLPFENPSWLQDRRVKALAAVNDAAIHEFGYTLDQHTELFVSAIEMAIERNDAVASIPLVEFTEAMATKVGISKIQASSWIESLSLTGRSDFFVVPEPASISDVFPWNFNRSWSYVRRPFVIMNEQVFFGINHIFRSDCNLTALCSSGRLKARTMQMRSAIGEVTHIKGEVFNLQIADIFRSRDDLIVRDRIKKFNGVVVASKTGDLGDFDVLVVQPKHHVIRAYECKDLVVSRTPKEISNELSKMFEGEKSIVAKHTKRVDWLVENTSIVLESLGIPDSGRWDIGGVVVVDESLVSPFIRESQLPVVTIADIEILATSTSRLP